MWVQLCDHNCTVVRARHTVLLWSTFLNGYVSCFRALPWHWEGILGSTFTVSTALCVNLTPSIQSDFPFLFLSNVFLLKVHTVSLFPITESFMQVSYIQCDIAVQCQWAVIIQRQSCWSLSLIAPYLALPLLFPFCLPSHPLEQPWPEQAMTSFCDVYRASELRQH